MKSLLFILLFLSPFFYSTEGQRLNSLDTNKYRINLPSHWKPGNRVWKIISDKLPAICPEIQDKELCGDACNPKYTIELEILEPLITDHDFYCTNPTSNGPVKNWVFLTYYNFQSSFLLLNENREVITRFILVDTTETWMVRKNENFRVPGEIIYRAYRPTGNSVTTSALQRAQSQQTVVIPQVRYRDNFNPMAYIEKNGHNLLPSDLELFTIIDKKIRAW